MGAPSEQRPGLGLLRPKRILLLLAALNLILFGTAIRLQYQHHSQFVERSSSDRVASTTTAGIRHGASTVGPRPAHTLGSTRCSSAGAILLLRMQLRAWLDDELQHALSQLHAETGTAASSSGNGGLTRVRSQQHFHSRLSVKVQRSQAQLTAF